MNVFKLRPNEDGCIELTEYNYHKETAKKAPWFHAGSNGPIYYAVCPACDNPIQIINLNTDRKANEDGRAMPLHARHVPHSVVGIADYNQDEYDNCSLAKPSSFSGTPIKRKPGKRSAEILSLLMNDADTVKSFMESSLGINISPFSFEIMLKKFVEQEGHLYRAINKLNLPYAVLYMGKNQTVAGGKPFTRVKPQSPFVTAASKSKNFEISAYDYVVQKSGADPDSRMTFFISQHVIPKGDNDETPKQILKLEIEEEIKGKRNTLFQKDIEFDLHFFYNTVAKKHREREIARKALAPLLSK